MKKHIKAVVAALPLLVVASCSDDKAPGHLDTITNIPTTDQIEFSTAEAKTNDAINETGYRVFQRLCGYSTENEGNVVMSPFGAVMSLATVANAADGASADKIREALGYSTLAELNSTCNKLMRYVPDWSNGAQMAIANSVWYSGDGSVSPSFAKTVGDVFYGAVNTADFSQAGTVDAMNKWCSAATSGRITDFRSSINPSDEVIFADALYFDGYWMHGFDKSETARMYFKGTTRTTTVEAMCRSYGGWYHDMELAEGITLELNGCGSITFLLPKKGVTIDELAREFSYEDWLSRNDMENCRTRSILLALPKITIECSTNIGEAMSMLGLTGNGADFGAMGIGKCGAFSMLQKVKAVFDEEGEQQGVTNILPDEGLFDDFDEYPEQEATRRLAFNRPFLFFVWCNIPKTLVLAGKVCNLPDAK